MTTVYIVLEEVTRRRRFIVRPPWFEIMPRWRSQPCRTTGEPVSIVVPHGGRFRVRAYLDWACVEEPVGLVLWHEANSEEGANFAAGDTVNISFTNGLRLPENRSDYWHFIA